MSAYAARKFGQGAALTLAIASAGLGVVSLHGTGSGLCHLLLELLDVLSADVRVRRSGQHATEHGPAVQTQIQQYDNMIKQGMSLPSRMFNTITGDLQRVASVYNSAQSLGRNISNLGEQFRQQFKGYDSYLVNSIGQGQTTCRSAIGTGHNPASITPARPCRPLA